MYLKHESEIVLKEKYGASSLQQRIYVKPADQTNIVVVDERAPSAEVADWFARVFLPQGYPDSVSKDYVPYQLWDTAQAFCSTIAGTLATQEVLRGVGVGDTNATPLAATVTWVIKDGCGHLGKILFAYTHGTYLDAYSKKWRLYADTLNDAAMCIEIALPMFKNYTIFALCVSTMMKAIVGVAGGATRVAMTQHHALRGNMADVSAKDSAQETAVNLIASFAALAIINLFGNSRAIFLLMVVLHIICNYFAVRAVCLRTLNETRFLQVIDMYLKEEIIGAPCQINRIEPIIFYQLGPNLLDLKLCGFRIKLGYSVKRIIKNKLSAMHLKTIKEIYRARNYILYPNTDNREIYVLIKEDATIDDILCAYFHAVLFSIVICAINDNRLPVISNFDDGYRRPFSAVCCTLQAAEWSKQEKETNGLSGFQYNPSYDLMVYVDEIANKEWRKCMRVGLKETGWELNKHILMVDEWRICGSKFSKRTPTREPEKESSFLRTNTRFKSTNKSLLDLVTPEDDSETNVKSHIIEPDSSTDPPEYVAERPKATMRKRLLNDNDY